MKQTTYIWRAIDYVRHRLTSRNTMGYGVHSPSLFQLVRYVLPDRTPYYCFSAIEDLRRDLLRRRDEIYVEDYGTGHSGKRKVSDVARYSLKPSYEAQLLMRLAVATEATTIIELGTSLGLTTAYLASAGKQVHVTTYEGSPELAKLAGQNWQKLGLDNITCVVGNIDDTLYKRSHAHVSMAFVDANHKGDAMWRYFEELKKGVGQSSLIVLDDIHADREMLDTWHRICQADGVTATIDLYSMGLVFFDSHLEKKTYKIRI